ncbi:hypothetical protein TTHERM_00086900 (macronuclear) [Tetrahymena thermophila SB210]|uniref:STOP protein n=1 Tax=Tetrahymena thermophila (strain SB210) TaxID=312017 RepID=Q236K7_TETTS|nr:hypothetical protein TTHERM_00086900 [Tetrahymena thermophila SB210]EAR92493.1 hypothetical protein TTHERM_00086900 [Tetrahymena thermophila SB210]|eukprot:XP_001012738.1 hypothetical protein TTHERM_00086900 [Tetrahymena thermophila SB210]
MWKSSLRKQSVDINKKLTKDQAHQQSYNVDFERTNTPEKRSMSAQRQKRYSTPNNQIDFLRVEEILKSRDPEAQFSQSFRMKTEDKEKVFINHFKNVQVPNQKYFNHLVGQCKCGKCSCNRCKCTVRELQPDYKRLNRSLYQADFQPKLTEVPQPFPQDKDPYRMQCKIELNTTQKTDFIPKKGVDPKLECGYIDRNTLNCGNQAIDHNTMYKNNFNIKKITPNVLFTHEPIEYLRVPHDKIKQKLTSEVKSNFREPKESLLPSQLTDQGKNFTYINFAYDRHKNLKPPIGMDDKMSLNTTARDSFKPFQPEKTQQNVQQNQALKLSQTGAKFRSTSSDPYNQEFIKTKNEWVHVFNNQQIPNHQGQFLSSKTQNFYPKNLNQSCEGWRVPDDIERLPKTAYMHAYA